MSHFLSQGVSYAGWLQSRKVDAAKFFFPHEYFTSLDVLDDGLPSQDKFHSTLRGEDISDNDYAKVVAMWQEKGWTNLGQHLEYYNTMDVLPFLKGM